MLVVRRIAVITLIVLVATTFAILPNPTPAGGSTPACDKVCWTEIIQRQENERIWWREVRAQQERERNWNRLVAYVRAQERRANLGGYPAPTLTRDGYLMGSGRCGPAWGLPPCWRLKTESGGLINVYYGPCHQQCHPRNTAQGKWAFINRTWGGFMGYRTAALAPEWVQDERARQLWAGGRGCSHWSAC